MEIKYKIRKLIIAIFLTGVISKIRNIIILIFAVYIAYLTLMHFARADSEWFTKLEQTDFYLYEPIKDTSVNLLCYGNDMGNCIVDVDIIEIWWNSDYIISHCRNYECVDSYYIVYALSFQEKSRAKKKVKGPLEYKEFLKEKDVLNLKLKTMRYRNLNKE